MRAPDIAPLFDQWTMSDGYVVRGRVWPPGDASPRAGVLYLHGIQSHGGWFEPSAADLNAAGLAVMLPDRRGSGLNTAARGDTPSAERLLADLDEHAAAFVKRYALERLAVLGVSWGGKLAVAWLLDRPMVAGALLLVAPGLCPAVDVGWMTRVAIGWALLTQAGRSFPIPLNDPALFTDEQDGQRFIADDPLRLMRATARFLFQSTRLDRMIRRAVQHALKLRTSAFLAAQDRIISNARTECLLRRLALETPEVTLFPDASHTLEFEADSAAYQETLVRWAKSILND